MATPKPVEIKVRVTREMKQSILALANQRGESESVIVREALARYVESKKNVQPLFILNEKGDCRQFRKIPP